MKCDHLVMVLGYLIILRISLDIVLNGEIVISTIILSVISAIILDIVSVIILDIVSTITIVIIVIIAIASIGIHRK